MKKVIVLCLALLVSSVSVFAQGSKRGARQGGDPAQRSEKMIIDLKLDEKQAADFRKVEAEFRDKMKTERKQVDSDRQKMREKMVAMRNERDAKMKKILTGEQYKKYLEMQRPQSSRKGTGRRR